MKCPRDGLQLARSKIDDIELDTCPECEGIWLDCHELEALYGLNLADIECHLPKVVADTGDDAGGVAGYLRCPRCPDGRLQQITYTFQQLVRIDRCDQCLGCWVDKGELDLIVQEKHTLEDEFSVRHLRT